MKSRITIFVSILLIASMLLSLSVNAQSIDAEFNKDSFFKQAQIINSSLDGITFELTETINKNILSTNKTHTILKIVPLNNESAYDLYNIATQIQNNSELTSNRGDLGKEKWDIAGTIQIYSRVFFTDFNQNGEPFRQFDKMTGGITAGGSGSYVGSGIQIIENHLNMGEWGKSSSGTINYDNTTTFSNRARSFSVNSPSSWPALSRNFIGQMGGTYSVTLVRASEPWTTDLYNNVSTDY